MVKRNLFLVSRENNAGLVGHDPATGNVTQHKYDLELEFNANATLSVLVDTLNTVMNTEKLMSNARIDIYSLDNTALRVFEAKKIINKNKGNIEAAQAELIEAVAGRMKFELGEETTKLLTDLVELVAATSKTVFIHKISDIRFMDKKNIYADALKKLVATAWGLCPMAELKFEVTTTDEYFG